MTPFDNIICDILLMFWLYVALSGVVYSEIFNVEKCCDLEIRVRGHSRSSEPSIRHLWFPIKVP